MNRRKIGVWVGTALISVLALIVVPVLANSTGPHKVPPPQVPPVNIHMPVKVVHHSDISPSDEQPTSLQCGRERWNVKTLTDADNNAVSLIPRPVRLAQLTRLHRPTDAGDARDWPREAPFERRTYQVHASLIAAKSEADGDFHLILEDSAGRTLIAEIPDPACAVGSRVFSALELVRSQFIRSVGVPSTDRFTNIVVPVVVTGVAFFDVPHGQRGVAPNAIELHPLIAFTAL